MIFDVDPVFRGEEEWYEKVATSKPPRDKPWYHVVVDGSDHSTYVAERHLMVDESPDRVDSPLVQVFFDRYEAGWYHRILN